MHAIPNPTWGGVITYTWADLNVHQWDCFRLGLFETLTEASATAVTIDTSKATNIVITEMTPRNVLIVQSPVIMQTVTELITSIVVSERDYRTNMVKYLPLYERKSVTINEVLKSYDLELRNTEQQLEVAERNFFIDRAIEDLAIYERDLGIKGRTGLSYTQRREQIIARNIASFEQTTEESIKRVAAAFSNGDVEINTSDIPGMYEIKFVGKKGIPDNIDGLKEAVSVVVPAHLEFYYTFTLNPWSFVADKTWGSVEHMSWNDLGIWEGARI